MGLFSKKKPAPSPATKAVFSFLYSGMKVEVLTPENSLIFIGLLNPLNGEAVGIISEKGGELPRAHYNQAVKLRCFMRNGKAFTLGGNVMKTDPKFWRVEELEFLQNSENRHFFRQNVTLTGSASTKGRLTGCNILDISAGGVRVELAMLLKRGDSFNLETTLLPGEEPFLFTCQVMRVITPPDPTNITKKYQYGCSFVNLGDREQERLLQSIFQLQRRMLQIRRE